MSDEYIEFLPILSGGGGAARGDDVGEFELVLREWGMSSPPKLLAKCYEAIFDRLYRVRVRHDLLNGQVTVEVIDMSRCTGDPEHTEAGRDAALKNGMAFAEKLRSQPK